MFWLSAVAEGSTPCAWPLQHPVKSNLFIVLRGMLALRNLLQTTQSLLRTFQHWLTLRPLLMPLWSSLVPKHLFAMHWQTVLRQVVFLVLVRFKPLRSWKAPNFMPSRSCERQVSQQQPSMCLIPPRTWTLHWMSLPAIRGS